MNRKQADIAISSLITAILLFGVISSVQLVRAEDPTMGHMEWVPAIHFVGPLFGSLVVASIVGVAYVVVRDKLFVNAGASDARTNEEVESSGRPHGEVTEGDTEEPTETKPASATTRHHILDILPEDEEKILEPVIVSPGITQIEVCDRSGYSRSKVSQTVTDLEKRGLLYRERQGRTYRVYPADDLDARV